MLVLLKGSKIVAHRSKDGAEAKAVAFYRIVSLLSVFASSSAKNSSSFPAGIIHVGTVYARQSRCAKN